jgi:hypothetical protein
MPVTFGLSNSLSPTNRIPAGRFGVKAVGTAIGPVVGGVTGGVTVGGVTVTGDVNVSMVTLSITGAGAGRTGRATFNVREVPTRSPRRGVKVTENVCAVAGRATRTESRPRDPLVRVTPLPHTIRTLSVLLADHDVTTVTESVDCLVNAILRFSIFCVQDVRDSNKAKNIAFIFF